MEFYTNILIKDGLLHVAGYKNGKKFIKIDRDFAPELFIPTLKSSIFQGSNGKNLKKVDVLNIPEWRRYVYEYKDMQSIYGNISPIYQYINKNYTWRKKFYDLDVIRFMVIDIEVLTDKAAFPNPNEAKNMISVITAYDNIKDHYYVFGLDDFDKSKSISGVEPSKISYKKFKDEIILLKEFAKFMAVMKPDVITGWNSDYFDIPYITNRMNKKIGIRHLQKMSPFNYAREMIIMKGTKQKRLFGSGGDNRKFKIEADKIVHEYKQGYYYFEMGIPSLDYLALYKKFMLVAKESYTLNFIASAELEDKKLRFKEKNLNELYHSDYQKYVDYNIKDVSLIVKLEEKLQLLKLAFMTAYETGALYNDIFYPVRLWDCIIYNRLQKENKEIIPNDNKAKIEYPGAFVKEPIPGLYNWVVSFDLNSLYPNIVIGWNLSRETLVPYSDLPEEVVENVLKKFDHLNPNLDFESNMKKLLDGSVDLSILKKHNLCMSCNIQFFSTDKQGVVSSAMEEKYQKRLELQEKKRRAKNEDKKNIYDIHQKAIKVLINSGYGAFANNYFRYFDINIASGITLTGQYIFKFLEKELNRRLGRYLDVIYGDTDSVYMSCQKFVDYCLENKLLTPDSPKKDILDKISIFSQTVIQKVIDESLSSLSNTFNIYKRSLVMTLEAIGDVGIWVTKKKYAINMLVDEDKHLEEPELKIKGLELVQSSTPEIVRDKLKELLKVLFEKRYDDLVDQVKSYQEEFKKINPSEIAFVKTVNYLAKYYDKDLLYRKGTPIQSRAALLHNQLLDKLKLSNKYNYIVESSKMRYVYLKMPNPIHENVIGFMDELPAEFGLHEFVDFGIQYEKILVHPINRLASAAGLNLIDIFNQKVEDITAYFE